MKHLSARLKYYLEKYQSYPKSKYFVPLAETYLDLNLFEEALKVLQEGLKWNPTYFIGRALLAQVYFQMGRFTQSFIEAQKVVSVSASNLLALRICAVSAIKLKEIEKATYFLDQLLKVTPQDQEILKLKKQINRSETIKSEIQDFQMVDLTNASKEKPSKERKIKTLKSLLDRIQKSP